jgi:ABC-type phosphate transport system substrate-binding protein
MLIAAFFLAIAMPAFSQTVVIISAKSVISKVTPDQVSQIFLGQSKSFYNGGIAVPIDTSDSRLRTEFYLKVTGKSLAQVKAHWAKLTFSGNAQPPELLPDSKSVVKKVAENPKYIGFVNKSDVDDSVKIVFTL